MTVNILKQDPNAKRFKLCVRVKINVCLNLFVFGSEWIRISYHKTTWLKQFPSLGETYIGILKLLKMQGGGGGGGEGTGNQGTAPLCVVLGEHGSANSETGFLCLLTVRKKKYTAPNTTVLEMDIYQLTHNMLSLQN